MVARGEFREDLLYRINLITLHLPPLRERRDDIPHPRVALPAGGGPGLRREPAPLEPTTPCVAEAQPWPGNVRQLRQAIERTVLVGERATCSTPPTSGRRSTWNRAEAERDVLPPVGSMTMDEIEKAMIVKSLKHHGGNISQGGAGARA